MNITVKHQNIPIDRIIDVDFDNLEEATRFLRKVVEYINKVERGAINVIDRSDAEELREFVMTFTDGEDPEENPAADSLRRIVGAWVL